MKTGSKAQKGFTLIEVSLAIVIGVIVLAGAITLYNQSKVSAGNSKASEKSLALASLVEEMAAANNGAYPTQNGLETAWDARRDDSRTSPWGGSLGGGGSIINGVYVWATGQTAGGTNAGYFQAGTAANGGGIVTEAASAGQMIYALSAGTASVWDVNSVAARVYANYIVGVANNSGTFLAFTSGGR